MKKLAALHPEKLVDLLTERLTFERAAVKLYDTVMSKMRRSKEASLVGLLGQMTRQRDEEREHEEWLEERVRELGSDAHTATKLSDLVAREWKGVMDVVAEDKEIPHLFHALLIAELVDDTGWTLLVQLADEARDEWARKELRRRALDEEEHLLFIRNVVAAFARKEVFGSAARLPASL